ncbi:hypothetical protein ACTG25_26505 [Aeromonas sp. 80P]
MQPWQQPEAAQEPAGWRESSAVSWKKAATPSPPSWSRASAGRQPETGPLSELVYGQSVTDACLCWDDTQTLLAMLADAVERRRQYRDSTRRPCSLAGPAGKLNP